MPDAQECPPTGDGAPAADPAQPLPAQPLPAQPLPPLPPFPAAGLRSGDVQVRAWDPSADSPDRLRLIRDPDQVRWGAPVFVPRPVNLSVLRQHAEHDRDAALAGHPTSYAVVSVSGGRLLGDIACRLDLPRMLIADLGYATLPEARGRGVASTALTLLSRWLLTEAQLARVQLDHAVGNVASCRVAARAGFEQEGVRRAYLPLVDPDAPGGWARHDVCLHGLLPG